MVSIAQSALLVLPSLVCLAVSALVAFATAIVNFALAPAMVFFSSPKGSKNDREPANGQNNNTPNSHSTTFVSLDIARTFESLVDSALPNPESDVLVFEAVASWLRPTKE